MSGSARMTSSSAGGRYYVPFAPFPAVALIPIVALVGPITADQLEPGINAALAAAGVGMCWWLMGRIGVARLSDRLWLTVLFGFSTQILWVTTRGGVWHTGHLVATILTFGCLIELFGRQRAWLVGLVAGAAFLSRAPLAFAVPFYALMLMQPVRHVATEVAGGYVAQALVGVPWRAWALLALGIPSIDHRVLPVQPGALRESVREWLCPGYPAPIPRSAAGDRALLAHAHPDEPGLLPLASAPPDRGATVLPARRARDVRADHEPGAVLRDLGPTGDNPGPGGCLARPWPS